MLLLTACSQPDFLDVEGNGIQKADLDKKWLIINYWATWCAPCRAEIPELNELSVEQKEKLNLLGVNFDQSPMSKLPQEVRQMKIEFPVFQVDPAERFGIKVPEVLPTTYIFSPGGQLVKTLVGPQTKESLLSIIEG